jgi:RNA polymerase sigma-70 factor (family 1)
MLWYSLLDLPSYSERELLGRLAAGDDEAFNIIYRRYNAMIFSAAMVYVKDTDSARDIVQQVLMKVWEKRVSMAEVDNFQDYIIVVSRNLIYDQFRKKTREARKILELAEHFPAVNDRAGPGEEREYARVLQSAIDRLPPQQKKIWVLVHEEQLSYEEVALSLGLSKLTVKKHLELARKFVRNYVTQYLQDVIKKPNE